MGDPNNVKVGPGLLYVAPLGSTVPTDLVTAWTTVDADWTALGYTDEGHEFAYEPNFEPLTVAEELDPIRYEQTGREMRLSMASAEMTYLNVQRAYNGGTVTVSGSGASTITTFEPPAIGTVTKLMIGWESQDHEERWVFYQTVQVGNVTIARRKSPDKATIPMEFRLELPDPAVSTKPFKAIFATPV